MSEVREPLLDPEADGSGGHAVGQEDVPDDVPPHQPLPLLLARQEADDEDGHGVRPGQEVVLGPPSPNYQGHIETEDKCEGYGCQLLITIGYEALKQFSRLLPLKIHEIIYIL